MTNETIAAIATPHGTGGISIIRISGPGAREILSRPLFYVEWTNQTLPATIEEKEGCPHGDESGRNYGEAGNSRLYEI